MNHEGPDVSLPDPLETPLHRTAHRRRQQWEAVCSEWTSARTTEKVSATVVVFDDREVYDTPFLQLCCQLNEQFCRRHGFGFRFSGGPAWPDLKRMPPHWARVAHLRALADELPRGPSSFIVSLDSDAAFTNVAFSMERLLLALPSEKSVFLAKDPPMWAPPKGWEASGVYCSGFVLLRLDESGRDFLDRWCLSFDPGQWWQSDEGRWISDGNWAGATYEQGQLNILAQGELERAVFELPQALFNSSWERPAGRPQAVVTHLMRRPGEWGWREKERRVEASFAFFLEQSAALAGAEDGIPRDAAGLQLWEEEEDLQAWLPMLQAALAARAAGERGAEDAGCDCLCGACSDCQRRSAAVGASAGMPVVAGRAEHACGPPSNVRFDACLGCIEVVD